MNQEEFQAWFDDFVLRARENLAKKGVEVDYCQMYAALRETLTVKDIITIMEQEKKAA